MTLTLGKSKTCVRWFKTFTAYRNRQGKITARPVRRSFHRGRGVCDRSSDHLAKAAWYFAQLIAPAAAIQHPTDEAVMTEAIMNLQRHGTTPLAAIVTVI
ncbi:MAG: hypothetical protein GPOALKHO_000389 [Sodalis sp.]|nr:MAG: hypothetical protein GPOALKHO_000389 [Sodalis sp.]